MKSYLSTVVFLLCALLAQSFTVKQVTHSPSALTTTSLNVFGNKKSEAQKEKESQYWQGEWVCKDCGYIYNRRECAGLYFEEQVGDLYFCLLWIFGNHYVSLLQF